MEILKVDNLIIIAKVVGGTVLATVVSCLVWKRIRKPEKQVQIFTVLINFNLLKCQSKTHIIYYFQ